MREPVFAPCPAFMRGRAEAVVGGKNGGHMVASRRSRLEPGPADLSTMLLRNVPPHNREAEQAVLGGVLLKPSLLDNLVSELALDQYREKSRGGFA